MFLGHDLQWWGAICGIVSLVIAVIGIFSPIFVPKVQNWWAERSTTSLRKRIKKLEEKLAFCERLPLISEAEGLGLSSIRIIVATLAVLNLMGELILLFVSELGQEVSSTKLGSLLHQAFTVFALSLVITYVLMYMAAKIGVFLEVHGPQERRGMKRSLEKLQAKLSVRIP